MHPFPREGSHLIVTIGARVGESFDLPLSPGSLLDHSQIEVPLNSTPPLQSTFLVWNPETRGLEYVKQLPPASPPFVGRSRLLSEASTVSSASTDSSGLCGDASDHEDEVEDIAAPPVPPSTPLSFKDGDTPYIYSREAPSLPAAATIEYLDRPPVSSRGEAYWKGSKDNLYKSQSFSVTLVHFESDMDESNSETLQVLS